MTAAAGKVAKQGVAGVEGPRDVNRGECQKFCV